MGGLSRSVRANAQDLSLHKARAAAGVPDPRSPEPHASAAKQMPSVGPDSEDEQGGQSNTECAHVACSAKVTGSWCWICILQTKLYISPYGANSLQENSCQREQTLMTDS